MSYKALPYTRKLSELLKMNKYEFKQYADNQLKRIQHRYFAADFECTTREPYTVYMVTIEDIATGQQWMYQTIDQFLMFCEMYPNSTFYFHNGENYDFEFIMDRVLKDKRWRLSTANGVSIKKQLNELQVTPKGTRFRKDKGDYVLLDAHIRFKDTRNIFTTSLAELGDTIGVLKGAGEIDTPLVAYIKDNQHWIEQSKDDAYTYVYHDTNYQADFIHNGWWVYAMQDTHVLAEVIRHYKIIEHAENNENTAAKISYNEMLNNSPAYAKQVTDLKQRMYKDEQFKESIIQLNKLAKWAYRGGIAWVNPNYTNKLIENVLGYHLDYNSMYPAIYMQPELYPLPSNIPVNYETDLYIAHYTNLSAKCKQGAFPLIKERGEDINGKPIKHSNSKYYLRRINKLDISLTSVEVEYLYQHYEDIQYDDCNVYYYEENKTLENALVAHGEKWYAEKQEASRLEDNARKMYAKMMLNTVYGYLGFFNKVVSVYDYRLKDGQVVRIKRDDHKDKSQNNLGLPYAEVPSAAFITAYGRVKLAEDINRLGVEHIVCCDTDSLFVINMPLDKIKSLVHIDKYELGALDKEHEMSKIIAIKAKTWCISNDDYKPIAQATAGSNYKFKDIRNFKHGQIIMVTEKVRGVGGIGIHPLYKQLGELDQLVIEDFTA